MLGALFGRSKSPESADAVVAVAATTADADADADANTGAEPVAGGGDASPPRSPTSAGSNSMFGATMDLKRRLRHDEDEVPTGQLGLQWTGPKDNDYGMAISTADLTAKWYTAAGAQTTDGTFEYYLRRGPLDDRGDYYGKGKGTVPWYVGPTRLRPAGVGAGAGTGRSDEVEREGAGGDPPHRTVTLAGLQGRARPGKPTRLAALVQARQPLLLFSPTRPPRILT